MDFFDDHRPPRILIVDDNPSIHRDFELVFLDESDNPELDADEQRLYGTPAPRGVRKSAYILEHAQSGMEGLEIVRREKAAGRFFQLAFVDIRMPGMDGVETIERLWRIDPKVQVVICTAYADYSQDELTQRLGQTDKLLLLKKPFDSIEVTQLARTLTEKWYLARQANLKLEQMERLVSQRTQRLLELQPVLPPAGAREAEAEEHQSMALVVTANAGALEKVTRALEKDRRVTPASGAEEGWDKARDLVPDLILIDATGTAFDAMELCRRLKGDLVTSHVPVVLITGREADQRLAALDAGADDCLSEPWQAVNLEERVAALMKASRPAPPKMAGAELFRLDHLTLGPTDARFLQRTVAIVEQHLSDFEFDVDALARHAAVSRRQLFRKLKALVDMTPKALIRSVRLRRAAQLLAESKMTVTEITFAVGFLDVKHFRALFKQEYGALPSDFLKLPPGTPPDLPP